MADDITIVIGADGAIEATFPAQQGLAGPPGPPGASIPGGALVKLSNGVVGGGRMVRYVDATHVGIASADTIAHLASIAGVSLTAASAAEQDVNFARLGEVVDSGWAWTPGLPVYLGLNGVLTQTHSPAWAFVLIVGVALSATRLIVDFRAPITQG